MKKLTSVIALILLTGCSTVVPVKQKFPEAPNKLLGDCPHLEKLNEGAQLSDVSKTVTVNYTTYYTCAVMHNGLVEWYKIQKNIAEGIK